MQCLKTIVCSYIVCCGKQRGKIKVYENYSREEGVPSRQHTHTIAVNTSHMMTDVFIFDRTKVKFSKRENFLEKVWNF